jgi:tRNA 2-(methylsulfanyl)-N6-isopentenyladenosine37 hydroxylase
LQLYVNFIDPAKEYLSADYVKKMWTEWLKMMAEVVENLEVRGDRVH